MASTGMRAQWVEFAYFEARGGLDGTWNTKQFETRLTGDVLLFHMQGELAPGLKYRIRQRLNKPLYDPKNPLNATDVLTLTWDVNPKWTLQAGKLPVFIGGYEWDYTPPDLFYYSDFAAKIAQVYALGATVFYRPAPGQSLLIQGGQSLLADGHADVWNVSLGWYGHIASWWKTIWGANIMDDPYHHMMGYLALGNRFEAGPWALELDGMLRRSLKQKKAGPDMSIMARMNYKLGKCLLFAKGGYDGNAAENVDPDGIAYDLTVAPGTSYWYGGGGVEYFPMDNRNVRIHAMAWTENRTRSVYIKTGLTFRLHLKKPAQ